MDRAVFSSLLADRRTAGWICAVGAVHLGLSAMGWEGWRCPIRAATGIPCPGCGLSRATLLLVRGEFGPAISMHAFAPVAVVGFALLLAATLSTSDTRTKIVDAVRRLELRTHLGLWLAGGLLIYWAARLFLDRAAVPS